MLIFCSFSSQDPFLYMLFSSALEVPAYTIFAPIVVLFGRRRVLAANFAVCAAAILAILITPGSETCSSFLFSSSNIVI